MSKRFQQPPLVYFDVCCWSRLFDDRSQDRERKEAEAMESLIQLSQSNSIVMASSSAVEDEVDHNPDPTDREIIFGMLQELTSTIVETDIVRERSQFWRSQGFTMYDAHLLAFAEGGRTEYICSCDDRFRKKAIRLVIPPPRVVGLIELLREVTS